MKSPVVLFVLFLVLTFIATFYIPGGMLIALTALFTQLRHHRALLTALFVIAGLLLGLEIYVLVSPLSHSEWMGPVQIG